jgi:hypothetical protein
MPADAPCCLRRTVSRLIRNQYERWEVCAVGWPPEISQHGGFQTGVRESAQSWRELLIDIKRRGLEIAPDLAVVAIDLYPHISCRPARGRLNSL